jgi:hypothetical protein
MLAQRQHLALVVVNGIAPGKKSEAAGYDHTVDSLRPSALRICTTYICNRKPITTAIGEGMGVTDQRAQTLCAIIVTQTLRSTFLA